MSYLGDIRLGDTLDFKFTTRQISGAPATLSSSPVISAYVGNSTTEITAGITLSVDFDSRTGLNNVRIVASGGNGYATASNYQLVITTGTVNSVSVVGEVVGEFSIENRSALMPTTAARTLVVDAAGLADANMVKMGATGAGTAQTARDIGASVLLSSGTGTGQLDFTSGVVKANATQWVGGTIPAVNVTGVPLVDAKYLLGTIFSTPTVAGVPNVNVKTINDISTSPVTTVKAVQGLTTADTIATYTGNTPQTGDTYALANGASGFVVIAGYTDSIESRLPAALVGGKMDSVLGAITVGVDFSATMKTSLNAATPAVTVSDKTGFSLTAPYDPAKTAAQAGDAMTLSAAYDFAKGTVAMAESYRANGATGTPAQILYEVLAHMAEKSISSTTLTIKKIDHATVAGTYTLNSATVPTSITKAT